MNPFLAPIARLGARRSVRQQKLSTLWNPEHWGGEVSAAGCLQMDGVSLPDLVAEHGSPLLAVSRSKLTMDAARFASAVQAVFPNAMIACSYKTNCVPGVLQQLHRSGFGAEVISHYELWLAERLGVPGERIVVNGVNKDAAFLRHAVESGVSSINIDEPGELALLRQIAGQLRRPVRVSLRLKVDRTSHFGLAIESGEASHVAGEIAASPELFEFVGLHFHALADNDDPEPHIDYARTALEFAAGIRQSRGLQTTSLNLGGGFTVPTMKVMSRFEYARQRLLDLPACPPDPASGLEISRYMSRLAEAIESICRSLDMSCPRIILEPGRILTSQSHVMLSKVHAVKGNRFGPDFAMTDAGKILTSYPCDYEFHQMFVANRMHACRDTTYHLMGRLCTSADWLAKTRYLPRLKAGDVVAIMDAGAYFTSYASNFAFPRPGIVSLSKGQVSILRHRESFEHLTAMDEIELG